MSDTPSSFNTNIYKRTYRTLTFIVSSPDAIT